MSKISDGPWKAQADDGGYAINGVNGVRIGHMTTYDDAQFVVIARESRGHEDWSALRADNARLKAEVDRLQSTYNDTVRDRDAYKVRLEDLQRRVAAVADSMNYNLPGGRRS